MVWQPVDVFPDAEAIAGTIVRSGVTGSRVYSSIPKKNVQYPLILVQRLGGTPVVRSRLDAADLQVDVWADSKSAARLLAAQARQALLQAAGTTVTLSTGSTAFVSQVADVTGPSWLPDPSNPPKARYTFQVRVFLHD